MIPKRREAVVYPPFGELTMLLYGEPGSGKTTFAGTNPDAFFIATEPGHDFQKAPVRRVYRWSPDPEGKDKRADFTTMVRQLWKAKEGGQLEYKTAIIDIVDNLYTMCLTTVCQANGVDYPPENDFGKTWKAVTTEWDTWIGRLMDIVNVNLITHCTGDKIELENAKGIKKEIDRRVPSFKGGSKVRFLDGVINAMGFVHTNAAGVRVITFKADATLGTKDRTGVLSELGAIPLSWTGVSAAYAARCEELGYAIASKW